MMRKMVYGEIPVMGNQKALVGIGCGVMLGNTMIYIGRPQTLYVKIITFWLKMRHP